jgi:hypothetical protein
VYIEDMSEHGIRLKGSAGISKLLLITASMAIFTSPVALGQERPTPPRAEYHVEVDVTREVGPANRALFSWVNYQRFSSEATFGSMQSFHNLNPAGTQARTEIMIDLMEPVNDNDDPYVYDWKRFRPDSMYRFIESDGAEFYDEMLALEMEPIALLTYNVEWLGEGGSRTAPPTSNAEWAEFAAAVVRAPNGSGENYEPRLTMIEVWNEPSPGGPYWSGTREEYFALFRAVAERIHEEFPGVKVGGPAVLSSDSDFMLDFIEACGDVADFYTMHFYNQDPVLMTRRIESWAAYIAEETAKTEPLLNVTESDNWEIVGPEKVDYLLKRQFELVRRSHLIAGFHHFSLPYYRERADRVFGLIRPSGEVIRYNYLPYWLFRGHEGELVDVRRFQDNEELRDARDNRDPLPLYATATTTGEKVDIVSYATSVAAEQMTVRIRMPEADRAYLLEVNQLRLGGVVTSFADRRVSDEDGFLHVVIDLRRGRAVRLNLAPERSIGE